jgi:hypothetical protein
MQLSSKIDQHIPWFFKVVTLIGLLLTNEFVYCGEKSQKVANAAEDPYISVVVRKAELVFIGSVGRLLESGCGGGGLAISHQGVVFDVRRVLKGDLAIRGPFTAYYSLNGSPLETSTNGCNGLSPRILKGGREFIVACEHSADLPKGLWAISGGPWVADRDAERLVETGIAKGDIRLAQYVWLRQEIDIERFLRGEDVPDERIQRSIEFFNELTETKSTQSNRSAKEISDQALQADLDRWRAWYEKHHECLAWDVSKYEVVDRECMKQQNR